jgi:hypothetical protein
MLLDGGVGATVDVGNGPGEQAARIMAAEKTVKTIGFMGSVEFGTAWMIPTLDQWGIAALTESAAILSEANSERRGANRARGDNRSHDDDRIDAADGPIGSARNPRTR